MTAPPSRPAAVLDAVVLAAGGSTRLGFPKQLLPLYGGTFLTHAIALAREAGARRIAVVLGGYADTIRPTLRQAAVDIVENLAWESGLASSLRAGVGALESLAARSAQQPADGAIILLCDQPRVTRLGSLVTAFERYPGSIAAARYEGIVGPPVILPRALFAEVEGLRGEQGARPLLDRHRASVREVPLALAALDVDTMADYNLFLAARR